MSERLQAPRGTFDILPDQAAQRAVVEKQARRVLERAGYRRIETPAFEATQLFERGVGQATDVVQKEMYSFRDGGGRSMTLRPEGTAPICRAYVEHGMHKLPQPVRLWYHGPYFRHEAPQAGRFRQFRQVGIEAIGSDDPLVDAEAILLLAELLEALGVRPLRLRLASLGTPASRAAYRQELRAYLRARESELSDDVRARLDVNPLRAFDSDHPGTRNVMRDAPRLLDRLAAEEREHFAAVRAALDAVELPYQVDPTLVRGLDYYTRTVFEFESPALGAQSGVGGGGRYDGLVEQLGGKPTPAVGFGLGIERLLLLLAELGIAAPDASPVAYAIVPSPAALASALAVLETLRTAGVSVLMHAGGGSMKSQFKRADASGARYALIFGDDEVARGELSLKNLRDAAAAQRALPLAGVSSWAADLLNA
ncbi:MAG TPA: histidine--tRNA ligase [Albitalea sp.]|nr:histidine--tRNA ligase [Albitalea sp.]